MLLFDVLKIFKLLSLGVTMNKISNIAVWIQRCALFVVVPLIIIMRLLSWGKINANEFCLAYYQMQAAPAILDHDIVTVPFLGKALFFILESVSAVCLLFALWYFLKILELYKKNQFFTQEVINIVKKINMIMLIWALYQVFFDTIASLMISLFKSAGNRYIMASIDFNDIIHLFIVLILFMAVHLIQEAHKIKSEQDLVV